MIACRKIDKAAVAECAMVYVDAYGQAPWEEEYRLEDVEDYIAGFLDSHTKRAYALTEDGRVIGVVLGLVIPCIGSRYFRLEDICIDPKRQRKGCGEKFLAFVTDSLKPEGCDSILLGTQRGYPSHDFYVKSGFREIDSVLLYREIGE